MEVADVHMLKSETVRERRRDDSDVARAASSTTLNDLDQQTLLARNRRLAEMVDLSHALVDNVSHEFRTPLAVLKEFVSLFLDGLTGELNDTQRDYLQIMATKVDDLTLMVNDLLDTSRIDAGLLGAARTPGTAAALIAQARSTLMQRAHVQKVQLRVDFPEDLPPIYADLDKAGRALVNLAVNAIKYSREGQTVEIRAGLDGDDEGMIRIDVTDCGPGIAFEHLEVIFDRFRQVGNSGLAAKGFGLGLAIVKELVQLNLGDVRVCSAPQEGSTFSFTLPVYDPPRLLARYFDQLGALKGASPALTLVGAEIDHDDPAVRDNAVEFVNRSLRPSDLFLPTARADRFLIVACSPSQEQVLRRLHASADDAYRGLPSRNVPRIRFAPLGGYHLGRDTRSDIIDDCMQALTVSHKEWIRV